MIVSVSVSIMILQVVNDIYRRFSHLLTDFDLAWFDDQTFAYAVHNKGTPLQQCIGFIDGTVRPIPRPVRNQRIMFSGHKRVHCIKFQVSIMMQ